MAYLVPLFPILPPTDDLSDLEDAAIWGSLVVGFDSAIFADPTILLDYYYFPLNNCVALVVGIIY